VVIGKYDGRVYSIHIFKTTESSEIFNRIACKLNRDSSTDLFLVVVEFNVE
jgi:hypothetical protein